MAQLDQAGYNPSLMYDVPVSQTFVSGNTKTVTDPNVRSGSTVVIQVTSNNRNGRWAIVCSAGSFLITSSDAESNVTFIYKIL